MNYHFPTEILIIKYNLGKKTLKESWKSTRDLRKSFIYNKWCFPRFPHFSPTSACLNHAFLQATSEMGKGDPKLNNARINIRLVRLVPSIMIPSWPWGSQMTDKKSEKGNYLKFVSKTLIEFVQFSLKIANLLHDPLHSL